MGRIGKIERVYHGYGGYQDAMIGFGFTLSGDGWAVGDFWGSWASRPEGAKYSEDEWRGYHADAAVRIRDLLVAAKATVLNELEGKPVMVAFEDNRLKDWRILTEAL
jgi:hypothetical protein